MSAWQQPSGISPDCIAVLEEFVRPLPTAALLVLRIQLKVRRDRIGTVGEQPCDTDLARVLDHEINHHLQLPQDLAHPGNPSPRFPA